MRMENTDYKKQRLATAAKYAETVKLSFYVVIFVGVER